MRIAGRLLVAVLLLLTLLVGGAASAAPASGSPQALLVQVSSGPAVATASSVAGEVAVVSQAFTAVADARVREASPTSSYASSGLATDGGPAGSVVRSYLRFSPSSVSAPVSRAVLRLYAKSSSSIGYQVRSTSGGWTESGLTWANAPAPSGTVTGSSGAVTTGAWTEVDVTSLVTGGGDVNLAITSTDQTQRLYADREAGAATAPQLVVTSGSTGGGGGDTTPPSTPVLTSATATSSSTVTLAWTAATDDVGVSGYTVYRDGVAVGTVSGTTTSYTDSGLAPSTAYAYAVDAVDAAGNRSPRSAPRSVTTPAVPVAHTFVLKPTGSGYEAYSAETGTRFTGRLKQVGEAAVAELGRGGGGTVRFTSGVFDFGSEYFKFNDISDLVFVGAGMDATVIRNVNSSASDTEPFNITGAQRITVRDLTVSAGGAARTTSDALDFDGGNSVLVERVRVTASRGRGIVFDGKGAGWTADDNVVRDCHVSGVSGAGIHLLASSRNRVEGCTISGAGRHGIHVGKASSSAEQVNKKSNDNVILNNTVTGSGEHGIFVQSSDRNQIRGNQVRNSSRVISGRDGIRIGTSDFITALDNTVVGNLSTDDQSVKTQYYGLHINGSLVQRTVIGAGNDFSGNLRGPVRDTGTGTVGP